MPSSTRTSFACCDGKPDPCLVCDSNRNYVDICKWEIPYPPPPPPPAEVEEETCGFPSLYTSDDRICVSEDDPDHPEKWIINNVKKKQRCKECEAQGEYNVQRDYDSDLQAAYLAAVQRCTEIPECSQVIGKRIEGDNPKKFGYLLQGCKDFPVTGDCSAHYDSTHDECGQDHCGAWCVYNKGEVTDGTCAEGTGAPSPPPVPASPPPVPGTRPVPKCPSSGWRSGYVVRTAPRPPRRILASHAVGVPRSRLTHMRLPLLSRARSGRRLRARRPCGGRRARRRAPTAPAGAKRRWWNRASCATRSRAATSGTALSKYGGLEGGTWSLSEPTQPLGASVQALERGPGKCTSSGPPCGAQSRGV